MTEQTEQRNCKECLHFEACCKWTDFPKQIGFPVCRKYRKQSEGEWIAKTDYAGYGYYCSICNAVFTGENAEWIAKEHNYCPKCGAIMDAKK